VKLAFGADKSSTSVQPLETNLPDSSRQTEVGDILTSDDAPVIFRHSGWSHARRRVRQALVDSHASPRAIARFDLCGSDPWVAVDDADPQRFTVLTNHCKSRWCVPCSRERAARIVGNLTRQASLSAVRFLTLTLKHSTQPLASQIDRIYAAFRALRRLPFWTRRITGGAAVLEIKRSWRADEWHVHLHCLIAGSYLPHAEIKANWWKITGDSNIVDIRPVHTVANAAKYISKYITKPLSVTVINKPDALAELFSACGRRRLVLTWGLWRGVKLSAKLDETHWRSLCPLPVLYERAAGGDDNAQQIITALEKILPDARHLAVRGPPTLDLEPYPPADPVFEQLPDLGKWTFSGGTHHRVPSSS